MEKQKLINYSVLIIIGIGVIGLLLSKGCISYNSSPIEFMTVANHENQIGIPNIKNVDVYMDFSGSMRGYLDFGNQGSEGDAVITSVVNKAMTKLDAIYDIKSQAHCGGRVYDQQQCLNALRDKSIYNLNTTLLDKMIETSCSNLSDTSVVVIVSDMILSYGKSKLLKAKDTFYNKHELRGLGDAIFSIATELQKQDNHIAILQYMSDYNGKYYCNYTENIKPVNCKNEMMKNRPFYVMIIGKETNIKNVLSKNVFCLSEKPKHIYSTIIFDMDRESSRCNISSKSKDWLFIEGEEEDSKFLNYSLQGQNLDNDISAITLSFDPINDKIPSYLNQELSVDYDSVIFGDVDLGNDSRELYLKLRPYNKLSDSQKTTIKLVTSNNWVKEANIDDDVNISSSELEGRTWGFETFIDNISNAYDTPNQTSIAEINILLTKK